MAKRKQGVKRSDENITFTVPPDLKVTVEQLAHSQDLNVGQLLRRVLRDWISKRDAETAQEQG